MEPNILFTKEFVEYAKKRVNKEDSGSEVVLIANSCTMG